MAIALIQERSSASSADNQSLAFNSNVTAGSLLLVAIRESGGSGTINPSVTDSQSNTYTKLANGLGSTPGTIALYGAVAGSSGACTVTCDGSSNVALRFTLQEFSGDFDSPVALVAGPSYTTTGTTSPQATASISPSGAALVYAVLGTASDVTATDAGTSWTLGPQIAGNRRCIPAHRIITSGGTHNADFAWTGTSNGQGTLIVAIAEAAPAGPTITVQPVADTVILTNETTASFSVTATGTGSLSYDWELEDGVGSGVYANLANGNGATWTGQTASSCSATLTAKTLTGRRVRCNVTDDNGTTTTNAVALTIWDGPQVTTFPATNGSGVSTATLTSDYVTGVGEAIEVRIPLSDGDVAVTVTTT